MGERTSDFDSKKTVGGTKYNMSSAEKSENTSAGPLFLSVWNWFANIPQTVNHIYTKSGEFLSRFTLLDAIVQFIFALATSCHPPEDGVYEKFEDDKRESSSPPSGRKLCDGVEVFGGQGRTLRSRTVEAK